MKKFLLSFIIFICLILNSKAQLNVSLTSNHGNDTIKTCLDTVITFYATTSNDGLPVLENVNYVWDFDDGNTQNGINLDTVSHSFSKHKGFRVRVIAEYNNKKSYDILPVEMGLIAKFTDTKTDINENFTGICPGEEFTLIPKTKNTKWEQLFNSKVVEQYPYLVENLASSTYNSVLDFKEFSQNDYVTDIANIDSIVLKIEHENLSNIQIKLTCPNETEVILKAFGGEPKYLGEPRIGDIASEGKPYSYIWNNSPQYSTINLESANYATIPSGSFNSETPLINLQNCPLNGAWTLSVIDNVSTQNGFVFEWGIYFKKDILPDTFKYENNYPFKSCVWAGEGVNSTNLQDGIAVVVPPIDQKFYTYYFYINDNFGCLNDTSLDVNIENAKFDIDKAGKPLTGTNLTAEIGDKLTFKDSTSWAVEYLWDFGDNSKDKNEKEQIHYFLQRGKYRVLYQAVSAKGCVDFDTAYITINALDTVTMYMGNYIFTPNGDGTNDFFSLFDGDEDYPGGKRIDSLTYTWDNSIDKDAANVSELSCKIFDRYGNCVCTWNTVEEALHGWDGTVNNNGFRFVSDGVYYFVAVIRLKNEDEKKLKPYKGTVYVVKKLE